MSNGLARNCWKEDRRPMKRIGRARRRGLGKEDWMGRMDSSKPLIMMKIPQDSGSVIPPKRAEIKTSPKMDMLAIRALENRGHCHFRKLMVISGIPILLWLP